MEISLSLQGFDKCNVFKLYTRFQLYKQYHIYQVSLRCTGIEGFIEGIGKFEYNAGTLPTTENTKLS